MKILYTASVLSHVCQFHLFMMKMLKEDGHEIHVAARDNLSEKNGLQLKNCDSFFDISFQRSPFKKQNHKAYKQLKRIINENNYDLIICNTPMCSVLTRLAARKARKNKTKVIYMSHGFHFYKGAPLKYWLIYPIEKFFANHYTDALITINKEDYDRSKKHFKCKVVHMHGVGVDSNRFHHVGEEEQMSMRKSLGLKKDDFVILCTGELNKNKNQKVLIEAVNMCKEEIPNIKLLIAGNGLEETRLKRMINDFGLNHNVFLLGYRTDLEKIVPCIDLVATASLREGMPLNVIEGMLCGKPVLASNNRGHRELIKNGVNGFLFSANNKVEGKDRIIDIYKSNVFNDFNAIVSSVNNYTSKSVLREFEGIMNEYER